MRWGALTAALWVLCAACGDDASSSPVDAGTVDTGAGVDGGTGAPDGGGSIVLPPPPVPPAAPALPQIPPCPDGWREVTVDVPAVGAVAACDPWPEGGRQTCAAGEAHFLGEPGCRTVGPECPVGAPWPSDLPADGVVYVRAGTRRGIGSAADPFATLAEAVTSVAPGGVIAIAAGIYAEAIQLPAGVSVRGACTRDVRIAPLAGATPSAALVVTGSDIRISGVSIGGGRDGIRVEGSGSSALVDGVIVDAMGSAVAGPAIVTGSLFRAAGAIATSTMSRSIVEGGTGITSSGGMFEDVAVIGAGRGVAAALGATATVRRCYFEDIADAAIVAGTGGLWWGGGGGGTGMVVLAGTVTVEQSVIRRSGLYGVAAISDSDMTIRRTWIDSAVHAGVLTSAAASLTVEDVIVGGTRELQGWTLAGGYGMALDRTPAIALARVAVFDSKRVGIGVWNATSTLTASDLHIVGTEDKREIDVATPGMFVALGPQATIDRARIERNRGTGLSAYGAGTSVDARDITIRDTFSTGEAGTYGRGVSVLEGAWVSIDGLSVHYSRQAGVLVSGAGSELEMRRAVIGTTFYERCYEDGTCPDRSVAVGLAARDRGHATLEDFVLAGGVLLGAQITTDGAIDLARGVVGGHQIAVNVQVVGYDIARLEREVVFIDNETALDATGLPTPELGETPTVIE